MSGAESDHSSRSNASIPWDHWRAGWRYVTENVAPLTLELKAEHEDFEVEELPSFTPSGEGEHLFLFIEKRGCTTPEVARLLARHFDVELKDVGWAGRKDARAVTRQWFSVRGGQAELVDSMDAPNWQVLQHTRNDRKLRLGALAGNRFRLLLRGLSEEDRPHAEGALVRLREHGLPNYFGSQRFGVSGRASELGLLLLTGRARQYLLRRLHPDHTPCTEATERLLEVLLEGKRGPQRKLSEIAGDLPLEFAPLAKQLARRPGDWRSALRALDRGTLGMHLSAWQSGVFNAVLSARFDGRGEPLRGDLLQIAGSGSLFEVDETEDIAKLKGRCQALELSISGPLPGTRAPLASGVPGEVEREWMEHAGITVEELGVNEQRGENASTDGIRRNRIDLPVKGLQLPGSRRPFVVPLETLTWAWERLGLRVCFDLPPGTYATTLVTELTKKP